MIGARCFDNLLNEKAQKGIYDRISSMGWEYGWKSNVKSDVYGFWHKHYAGQRDHDHRNAYDCAEELKTVPILFDMWAFLRQGLLRGHTLVRCYANGQPYGTDGTLHYDSKAPNSFTSIYYPHLQWSPNWGGETVFFNKEETDVVQSIFPKPNRLIVFPGTLPHAARGVSRTCPVMRITLMFKTEYGKGLPEIPSEAH